MLILFFSATKLMNASLFYISQLLGYRIFRWLFNFSWLFNFTKFWWYKVTYYPGFNPRPTLGTTNTNNTPTNAFQSTPPRGGRRSTQALLSGLKVSIHAPARGATLLRAQRFKITLVSIHAPARGATGHKMRCQSFRVCFNPRPRAGGDS